MSEAVHDVEPLDTPNEPDALELPPATAAASTLSPADGEPGFDDASGISEEDAREVLADIEKVVTANRIAVDDEIFAVSPAKQGVVFPVVINLSLLLVLAGGIATFAVLFRMDERSITESIGGVSSAEGRLIEEIRRESEEQILQKNREIEQIQQRLAEIQQERLALEADITSRISKREQQLRLDLQAELAAERARLQTQGVSEAEIAQRLRRLEAERTEAYNAQLALFREEAEAERRRVEQNLQSLQAEYTSSLQNLDLERQELLAQSQQREQELRAQLESRTQALEEQKSSIERQLEALSEQREREELAEQQLIGFYEVVKDEINAGDYEGAENALAAIRSYLDEEGIADLPAVLQRREVEFFVIDALSRLVESQQGRAETNVASVVAQAELITRLRERASSAQTARNSGDLETAERIYREALAIVPEVEQGMAFLESRAEDAEAARRAKLDAELAQAEAAVLAGNYQTALQRYETALLYLPRTAEQVGATVESIARAGYELESLRDRASDAAGAEAPLTRARGLLQEGLYYEAVLGFVDVLARYPGSPQAAQAVEGVNNAVAAGRSAIERGAGSLQGQITELEDDLAARLREIEELQASLAEREQSLAEAEASLSQLQEELQDLKERTIPELNAAIAAYEEQAQLSGEQRDQLVSRIENEKAQVVQEREALVAERDRMAATIDTLNQEIGALREEVAALRQGGSRRAVSPDQASDEEIGAEMDRLLAIEQTFDELRRSYRRYAQREDLVLASQGEAGLLETKLYLDDFLTSDLMEQSFPGLWGRIKKYDQAFEEVGRRVAAQDLTDTVYELTLFENDAERIQYLERQIAANSDNEPLVQLLQEIRDLVQR
jgi:hypothetical protein